MIGNLANDAEDPKEERRKLREQRREERRRHREEKERNLAKGLATLNQIISIVICPRMDFSLISCNYYSNVLKDCCFYIII